MRYLLDTNTLIDYLNAKLPPTAMQELNTIVDDEALISVITKIETLGYNFTNVQEQRVVEAFVNGSTAIYIDDNIVDRTIDLRKTKKMKLPDAIIAATALVHNLTLLSRNISDFKNINGLTAIDPHSL